MESGRSTPVAMSRPSSRHISSSELEGTNPASGTRPPESTPATQNLVPQPTNRRPECYRAATFPSNSTSDLNQRCLFQSILENRASSIAILQGSVLTAIGLGWAVYSRIFRFNVEAWLSKFSVPKPNQNQDMFSDFATKKPESPTRTSPRPRLDTSAHAREQEVTAPIITVEKEVGVESESRQDSAIDRNEKPDGRAGIQTLLQKHMAYLEPWISKQPIFTKDEGNSPESKIESEMRRMSLAAFTDLSTAIYKDVRRRENESSPLSPNPPQTPGTPGHKENDARMVLCRTINEQYLRLVLALVLELARRIAGIRVEIKWQSVIVGN